MDQPGWKVRVKENQSCPADPLLRTMYTVHLRSPDKQSLSILQDYLEPVCLGLGLVACEPLESVSQGPVYIVNGDLSTTSNISPHTAQTFPTSHNTFYGKIFECCLGLGAVPCPGAAGLHTGQPDQPGGHQQHHQLAIHPLLFYSLLGRNTHFKSIIWVY